MRSDNIDILKAVSSFLIVCIHTPFSGIFGNYFTVLTRIAVPLFFMITGYFYINTVEKGRVGSQIKKIVKLVFISNIIYFIWDFLYAAFKGESSISFIYENFTVEYLLKFVLNESPFAGHLWYLGAILYVLIIVFLLDKANKRKILYYITPFLLAGDLILGKYSIVVFHKEFPYYFARNFLFVGIPFFCLGCMIKEYSIKDRIKHKTWLWIYIVLFTVTSLVEKVILDMSDMSSAREHYLSTTFLAIAVFIFTLHQTEIVNSLIKKQLVSIGRKYSTWIYILHPIFILVIAAVARRSNIFETYIYFAPFIVYIVTLVFLIAVEKLKEFKLKGDLYK